MRKTLLVIGKVWPEPTATAAASRMLQLLAAFLGRGWNVKFSSSSKKQSVAADLSATGIEEISVALNSTSFDDLIQKMLPDVVLFDRFMTEEQFGWRVAKHSPQSLRILDTEDLHCLRESRRKALVDGVPFKPELLLSEEIALREMASIYRSDFSLMISEFEMQVLSDQFNIDDALLHYLPFMSPELTGNASQTWKPFEERQHFVTVGNFLHQPNVDSVKYLKASIWPLIRKKLPEAQMHVYGAYASDHHLQLSDNSNGFLVKGFAEDVNRVMADARVCLAPLRYGAGLKGKLLDAMMNGLPSVTTSIGAEGMNGESPWPGFIADDPKQFADNAVKLYQNEEAWQLALNKIFPLVNTRFSKSRFETRFLDRVEELLSDLASHRSRNFIGAMLNHHTMRSTEFMARWIEAKNRVSADQGETLH